LTIKYRRERRLSMYDPPAHEQILDAVIRLCRERGSWRFTPHEIVRALPHINESTVRTHVVSRCCVDAPANHEHTWDYFRRVERGVYELRPVYRRRKVAGGRRGRRTRVGERTRAYTAAADSIRDTVHAVVGRSSGWYVAECLEVAVTTQGSTLDELAANLREAVALHLEGEDARSLGIAARPRLSLTYELAL
jgi:predicted RNase H-like HicB family nuclease